MNNTTSSDDLLAMYQEDAEAVRQLALDPATTPTALIAMGQVLAAEVGALVVQNPNTPLSLLKELGQRYPKELFQNPILPILLLEGFAALCQLLSEELCMEPSAPVYFLSMAAMFWPHARLLALHPNTPKEALQMLFERGDPEVCRALVQHRECPEALLAGLSCCREVRQRAEVASHLNTAPAILERLAKDPEPSVRAAVASNPKTPALTRAQLCKDSTRQVSRAAKTFPVWLMGREFSLGGFARAGFQPAGMLSLYQTQLKDSETFKAQHETYRDEDCLCCWCYLWRDDELTQGDNTINPLDLGVRRLHRTRKPKSDPGRRKPHRQRASARPSALLASRRGFKQS